MCFFDPNNWRRVTVDGCTMNMGIWRVCYEDSSACRQNFAENAVKCTDIKNKLPGCMNTYSGVCYYYDETFSNETAVRAVRVTCTLAIILLAFQLTINGPPTSFELTPVMI